MASFWVSVSWAIVTAGEGVLCRHWRGGPEASVGLRLGAGRSAGAYRPPGHSTVRYRVGSYAFAVGMASPQADLARGDPANVCALET